MKPFHVLILCLLCAGCAMSYDAIEDEEMARRSEKVTQEYQEVEQSGAIIRRFVSLRQIYNGMSRKEVNSVLNDQVLVGYEMPSVEQRIYKPITENNPYRVETLNKGKKEYTVDYYLVGIRKQDGLVTDDELVPLVFLKDKLVGSGWSFLNQEIKSK